MTYRAAVAYSFLRAAGSWTACRVARGNLDRRLAAVNRLVDAAWVRR